MLLKEPSWWLSALPVVVLAGPWMALTTAITAQGMDHSSLRHFITEAATFYAQALPSALGWALTALALAGLIRLVFIVTRNPGAQAPHAAAFCALVIGMCLVLLLIPAGFAQRYLLPVLPVLLVAAALAAHQLCGMLPRFSSAATVLILTGSFALVAALRLRPKI